MMRIFEFPVRGTENPDEGRLQFIEEERHVPFPIRRVYYSTGVKAGVVRGRHAHRALEQVLVCVSGCVRLDIDTGRECESFVLDDPSVGAYVGPRMWHTMTWLRDDSVLLVLASDFYSEADYIRNYDDFVRLVRFPDDEKRGSDR
jgi:dTDP-4-dehydrorhamnose 3,5-epimerase-like enzyme